MAEHDVDSELVAKCLREIDEDSTAEGITAGLDAARATLAEIWARSDDDALRRGAMRALRAVISAERTMAAADAFLLATTRPAQREAFEKLRATCCLRVGHDVRRKP